MVIAWNGYLGVVLAPIVAVAIGHLLGVARLGFQPSGNLVGIFCVAGIAMLVRGAWTAWQQDRRMHAYLAGYALFFVLAFPIDFANSEARILRVMPALVPVVFALAFFLRKRIWVLSVGAWLVLLATTLILTYNVTNLHSGIGFWGGWRD